MPILSIVMMGLIIYIIATNKDFHNTYKKLLVLLLISEIIFTTGGIFQIGDKSIMRRSLFMDMFVAGYCVYGIMSRRVEIGFRLYQSFIVFCGICIILIGFNFIYPYDGYVPVSLSHNPWDDYVNGVTNLTKFKPSILAAGNTFIRVASCGIIIITSKACLNKGDLYGILTSVIHYMKYYYIIGVLQFVIANCFGANDIFLHVRDYFTGPTQSTLYGEGRESRRGGLVPIMGLSMEPSHFVMSMYYYCVLLIMFFKINNENSINIGKQYKIYFFIGIVMMFLSGGFSSFWYAFMLGGIYFWLKVRNRNGYNKKLLIQVGSLFLFSLGGVYFIWESFLSQYSLYYADKMDRVQVLINYVLSGKFQFLYGILSVTEMARFTSLIYVSAIFIDRPILGMGLAGISAFDITISMLANFGIIGVLGWVMFVLHKKNKYTSYDALFFLVFFFIGGLPSGSYIRGIGQFYFIFVVMCTSLYCSRSNDFKIL